MYLVYKYDTDANIEFLRHNSSVILILIMNVLTPQWWVYSNDAQINHTVLDFIVHYKKHATHCTLVRLHGWLLTTFLAISVIIRRRPAIFLHQASQVLHATAYDA